MKEPFPVREAFGHLSGWLPGHILSACLVFTLDAVVDDSLGAFTGSQASQISQADFSYQNIDVVFCMIDMRHHWHDTGNHAIFGNGFGNENSSMGVMCESPEPPIPFIIWVPITWVELTCP